MNDVPELEDVPQVIQRIKSTQTKCVEKLQQKKDAKQFAGMQKGFLGKTTENPEKKKASIHLPHVKAAQPKNSLVLEEVQKAMREDFNIKDFQEDLSARLESNDDVSKVLEDPLWLSILSEFQQDAEKAMQKYKNNETVKSTMLKLCNVFGESFLHMGVDSKNEEEQLVEKLMGSPLVKEALLDPYVSRMMDLMKANRNDQVMRMLREADIGQKQKIQVLVDHGLFSFQS